MRTRSNTALKEFYFPDMLTDVVERAALTAEITGEASKAARIENLKKRIAENRYKVAGADIARALVRHFS